MQSYLRALMIVLLVGAPAAAWQGPLYDTVIVDLPYTVRLQDKVLQPGEYKIQEHRSAADTGVLHVFSDKGMDFETSFTTIDALDRDTPNETKLVLTRIGDDYYLDKIWIQGKNYGYQMIPSESMKARQQEARQSVDVKARYERQASFRNRSGASARQTEPATSARQTEADASARKARADRVVPDERMRSRLAREVRHELVMLPFYSVFDNFSYRINGGTVELMGQVTRPTLKSSAENVVKDIEGVERVVNNIEVLPVSPNDDRIRLAAYRAIYGHSALDRYSLQAVPPIHLIVKNGHLTLEGVVATEAEKNIANIQARGVPGVFSVTNNLRVEKS